jgi:V/A-type H+-transporting ATPase subunit I
VGTVAAVLAVIGAVGIVLTGGRSSRSWVKRILKGAYSAYGISSYLSDILSYARLLALGLATGVIATVFNKMGTMLGGGVVGSIIFLVVFLVGHVLNLAINVLGAYVHTNRLTFVEFFGKFYDGGGRKFQPFAVHTKYYKFKEEIKS